MGFGCKKLNWEKSLIWQSPKGGTGVPCGSLSLCLLPHEPSLGAQGLLGCHCLGYGTAPRATAGEPTSPQRLAKLREGHKTGSNVWFFHLPLRNADVLFGSWVSLEKKECFELL